MAPNRKQSPPRPSKRKLAPGSLRVIEGENGFVLVSGETPILTPGGRPLTHTSSRLLDHIRRELSVYGTLEASRFGPYSIYSTQHDFLGQMHDAILADFNQLLFHDPLLHRSAGPEQADQLQHWHFVLDFLRSGDCDLPQLPFGPPEPTEPASGDADDTFDTLAALVRREYVGLSNERKTLLINLMQIHDAGLLLPLMLVTGRCSGEEYGEAVLAAQAAHPSAWGTSWKEFGQSLRALREDARIALEYLVHC